MSETLKQALGSRTVLFVDDNPYTVDSYIMRLHDVGVTCELCASLDQALAAIKQNPGVYGVVLIDLSMPTVSWSDLQPQAEALQLTPTSFNQGRSLGLWLWQQRQSLDLPYAYLSALPHVFGAAHGEWHGQTASFVLNKANLMPSQMAQRLLQVLKDWNRLELASVSSASTASSQSGGQP